MGGRGQPSIQGSGMQNFWILWGHRGISCMPLILQQSELRFSSQLPALHLGALRKSVPLAGLPLLVGLSLLCWPVSLSSL